MAIAQAPHLLVLHSKATQQHQLQNKWTSTILSSRRQGFGSSMQVHLHWPTETHQETNRCLREATGLTSYMARSLNRFFSEPPLRQNIDHAIR